MRKSTTHMFFLLSNCTPSHYFKTLIQTLMTILFSPIHRHILRCSTACIDISMNDFKIVYQEVIKCFQLFTTVSSINNQLYTSLYSLKIWVRIKCQDRVRQRQWSERTEGMEREQREVNRKLRLMTLEQGTVTLARSISCCTITITTVLFSSVYLTNTAVWVTLQLIILYIIITWGETLLMHIFFSNTVRE